MSELVEGKMYNNTSYRVESPDGTMFVHIADDENGKPIQMQINIGKAGSSLSAWASTVARLVTVMLNNGFAVNDIIKELSQTTSDKSTRTTEMIPVRSGVDAVCVALMNYRKDKFRGLVEILNGREEEEYRSGTLG